MKQFQNRHEVAKNWTHGAACRHITSESATQGLQRPSPHSP